MYVSGRWKEEGFLEWIENGKDKLRRCRCWEVERGRLWPKRKRDDIGNKAGGSTRIGRYDLVP